MSKWISVKDELPKVGDDVIVFIPTREYPVNVCWLDAENDWQNDCNVYNSKSVTHWQPLPEPPEDVIKKQ